LSVKERITLEGELIRKCLSRNETQCSFLEHRGYKVIYRRYASLYFIIGMDADEEVIYPYCILRMKWHTWNSSIT
jgi:AP-4 complex subunit sigma-1